MSSSWNDSESTADSATITTPLEKWPRGLTEDNKVALVLGSESEGISEKMLNCADWTVHYPMQGKVESLNVAVCGALTLHEITNYFESNRYTGMLKFQKM